MSEFMISCKERKLDYIISVLDLNEINTLDSFRRNCIFYSLEGKNFEVFDYLLSLNMSNLEHRDCNNENLLDLAKRAGHLYEDKLKNTLIPGSNKCPCFNDNYTYTYELERIIFEDDLSKFETNFSKYEKDILALACRYNSTRIAMYCIDNKIGLNVPLKNTESTPFIFACFYNNLQIAEALFPHLTYQELNSKNEYNKIPIMYATSSKFNRLRIKLTSQVNNVPDYKVKNLTNFKYDDFISRQDLNEKKGAYGDVKNVIHNESKTKLIIKKYSLVKNFITRNIMVETMFLKLLNNIYTNITSKLIGIIIQDDTLNIVQDSLIYTLDDMFIIMLNYDDNNIFLNKFKELLYNLLVNIYYINSIGISHNDIKEQNVMIDINGKLIIIDFGLSQYLGMSPLNKKVENLFMNYDLKPGDLKNNITLTTDVFSIGGIFINLLEKRKSIFLQENFDLYKYTYDIYTDKFVKENIKTKEKTFINEQIFLGNLSLRDLFTKMLIENKQDYPTRWYPEDCLEHQYFSNKNYLPKTNNNEFTHLNSTTHRNYTENNKELRYYGIIKILSNKLKFENTNQFQNENVSYTEFYTFCNYLYNKLDDLRIYKYDVFITSIPKILHFIKHNLIPVEEFYIYSSIIVYMCILQHEPSELKIEIIKDFIFYTNSDKRNELNSYIQKVIELDISTKEQVIFNFIPISSTISNFIFQFQLKRIDLSIINDIEKYIKHNLIIWVTFNRTYEIPIIEILSAIYYTSNYNFNIDNPRNENIIQYTRQLIRDNSGIIHI
jgi:serine/threonine protein kinase